MQYAQVALNSKTQKINQLFTYEIPPSVLPQIKIGALVLIPFRNQIKEGIVIKLVRQKTQSGKFFALKKIISVLSEKSVLENWQIELAEDISNYYISPFGETIFALIPEFSRKNYSQIPESKRYFQKSKGKIFTFFQNYEKRINFILAVLKKYPYKKTLILFPNKILLGDFAEKIPLELKNQTAVLSDDLSREEKFQNWLEIKLGKKNIIPGTRKTILAPFIPEIIFLTEPGHFGYKNEQEPRFNSFWIARWFVKNFGTRLFILDEFPNAQIIYRLQKKEYQGLNSRLFGIQNSRLTKVIDRSKEKGVIGFETEEAIAETLAEKGKVIIYLNRRGYGSAVTCRDCGAKILCPRCEVPLINSQPTRLQELSCHYCNYRIPIPARCPNCQGPNLIKTGLGTENLYSFFQKEFPLKKIILIDKDYKNDAIGSDFDILIATKKLLEFPPLKTDLLVIVNPDNSLAIPDYSANENLFIAIKRLMGLGDKIFIETYNPNLEIFSQIRQDAAAFFRQEMSLRKNALYPPFSILIRLLIRQKDNKKAESRSLEILRELGKLNLEAVILGPSPCYLSKIRGFFRWQIILKIRPENLSETLKKLKNIYGAPDLSLDVEPINLL